ncbi:MULTISPECIES: hydroxymethylglutaryl-CoA lyase [unclassified Cytobacillus]|uniref:hydroxymethylglutaryl-CoA lyase n=1 Tax=unclassified Cytobacillus TaxID=2675268 RepID=UPI00135A25E9|nr:hydroxymethylglutaryl-CoA lyase [Cytobacillus sp. AMY 15.2]KAF0817824.1 Pyruvate:Oxaloacetate transcarboxylase domain protein [Bacillus sp. ZZV12-4809]MCM3089920.1 hydroxymethylglutaryl-CoA lyase [Cytobacillus sp. AMY 15.2]
MIEICEVGPRDGLQNECKRVSTSSKVELITKLLDSGIRNIEAVSFVNPKVVPQMADAEEVLHSLPKRSGVRYGGLVLSRSGLERALKTDVNFLHVVTTTSDSFNLRNAKRTVEQAVEELCVVIQEGAAAGKGVAGVLGTSFGCPFEGEVPLENVLKTAERFMEAGCTEITLADTTGMANPIQVKKLADSFFSAFGGDLSLGLHFHNTRGLGLANVLAGYQAGVRRFDSSIAGLGGCPFAPKAVGNVCTEDMINMFHEMGVKTGTDLPSVLETARWMETVMERPLDGMLMKAGIA